MLHFALILLTGFDGFANLRFSKRRDQYIMTLRPHHLNEKKWAPRESTKVPAWIVYWPHNPARYALPAVGRLWPGDDGGGGDGDDDVADKGGMLHCLDLIGSLGWLANLCFSKSVFLRLTLTFNSAQSLQNNDCEAWFNHHKKSYHSHDQQWYILLSCSTLLPA